MAQIPPASPDSDLMKALPIVTEWLERLEAIYFGEPATDGEMADIQLAVSLIRELKGTESCSYFLGAIGDVGRFLRRYIAGSKRPVSRPALHVIEGGKHPAC